MIQLDETLLLSSTIDPKRELLNTLEEIVNKVEIKPNFSISHPDYQPLEVTQEILEHLQKMPEDLQKKYLSLLLRTFLYGIYYNGSMRNALGIHQEKPNFALDLENNTFLEVDVEFYERLQENNHGEGYFDSDWSILHQENDGTFAVIKGGLRLHIEKNIHLQPHQKNAQSGDIVSIRMPKNLLQNGFYVAVGNEGLQSSLQAVRMYFNFTPEGAVKVMDSLTQELNQLAIPFSFKVLYNPGDYGRYDSGVLYFDKHNYRVIKPVLLKIYQAHQSEFKSQVPLFTLSLAPGLGLAEEPEQKFAVQESFGMNRCQLVANGLIKAWYQKEYSSEGGMRAILEQFNILEIDLERPYLNPNAEDIY
ncbi:conserved hypothetical protein [Gloeothece citriformis PCC 7424]|uniref:Uncharacterized protein n=1 Tax=Gloeothece citriformis (strain PCC 7424) TaxID=65393 RepID=B7KC66_GLOC7|nr:T3SS effector HopA1 family protein [Gloeothece citriformis]ACK68889.1 conserved hypothetical protein [Gloeothece citriformis PCC 7424]